MRWTYMSTLKTKTSLGACRKCLCWLPGLSGSPATSSTQTDQPPEKAGWANVLRLCCGTFGSRRAADRRWRRDVFIPHHLCHLLPLFLAQPDYTFFFQCPLIHQLYFTVARLIPYLYTRMFYGSFLRLHCCRRCFRTLSTRCGVLWTQRCFNTCDHRCSSSWVVTFTKMTTKLKILGYPGNVDLKLFYAIFRQVDSMQSKS